MDYKRSKEIQWFKDFRSFETKILMYCDPKTVQLSQSMQNWNARIWFNGWISVTRRTIAGEAKRECSLREREANKRANERERHDIHRRRCAALPLQSPTKN